MRPVSILTPEPIKLIFNEEHDEPVIQTKKQNIWNFCLLLPINYAIYHSIPSVCVIVSERKKTCGIFPLKSETIES